MPKHPKGFTSKYTEEVVVRIWRNTYKSVLGIKVPSKHMGHAAVTVRGNATGGSGQLHYISWWPGEGVDLSSLKQILKTGFKGQESISSPKYVYDKVSEMSPKTVENHRTRILHKLGVHSTFELIRYAAKVGIIDVDLWKD